MNQYAEMKPTLLENLCQKKDYFLEQKQKLSCASNISSKFQEETNLDSLIAQIVGVIKIINEDNDISSNNSSRDFMLEINGMKTKIERIETEIDERKKEFARLQGDLLTMSTKYDSSLIVHKDTLIRHFAEVFLFNIFYFIFCENGNLNIKIGENDLAELDFHDLSNLPELLNFEMSETEKTRWRDMNQLFSTGNGKYVPLVVLKMKNNASKFVYSNSTIHLSKDCKEFKLEVVEELIIEKFGIKEGAFKYGSVLKQFHFMKQWLEAHNVEQLHTTFFANNPNNAKKTAK